MQRRTYLAAAVGGVGVGILPAPTQRCHDGGYGTGIYGAGTYAGDGGGDNATTDR